MEKRPLAQGYFQALFCIDAEVRRASTAGSLRLVLDSGPLSDERNPGPKRLNHLFRATWLAWGRAGDSKPGSYRRVRLQSRTLVSVPRCLWTDKHSPRVSRRTLASPAKFRAAPPFYPQEGLPATRGSLCSSRLSEKEGVPPPAGRGQSW